MRKADEQDPSRLEDDIAEVVDAFGYPVRA